ncbi:MAG: DUF6000 family protein [Bacteroidota bacterium]
MGLFDRFRKKKPTKEQENALELHVAGATVRFESPFDQLTAYRNDTPVSNEFIKEWVAPFYFNLNKDSQEWVDQVVGKKPFLTDEVILTCLGDFNWRTRQTGAFFAAIMHKTEFTDIIGTHLIKSEVCFAGREYAKTLAAFNNEAAIGYLDQYLGHYLLRKDLDFDQQEVMQALIYLDEINGTRRTERHRDNWNAFVAERSKSHQALIEQVKANSGNAALIEGMQQAHTLIANVNTDSLRARLKTIEAIRGAMIG